jgi:hypothetical protein
MINRTQTDVNILRSIKIIRTIVSSDGCLTWKLVDSMNWLGYANGCGEMDLDGGRIIS